MPNKPKEGYLSLNTNDWIIEYRDNGDLFHGIDGGGTVTGTTSKGNTGGSSTSNDDGDFWGMIFKGSSSNQAAPPSPSSFIVFVSIFLSLFIIFILDISTNHVILLSLLWCVWSHNWGGKTIPLY